MLVVVGLDELAGKPGDLDSLGAAILVRVVVHDPGLVELIHGAELGLAVDAEVEADLRVEFGAGDEPLVLGVGDGNEQRALGAGHDDQGVDPEGHHHVLSVVVQMAEVGEVAGVRDDDSVAAGGKGRDEILRSSGGFAGELGLEGGGVVLTVKAQAIQDVGEGRWLSAWCGARSGLGPSPRLTPSPTWLTYSAVLKGLPFEAWSRLTVPPRSGV